MPEGFEIIRARIKDDIPVLIDRILRSKQKEIILVLPKNSIISANPDSIKLLKQEAESVNKTLSLSTENSDLKSFAKEFDILIYNSNKIPAASVVKQPVKMKRMMDVIPPSFFKEKKIEITPEPDPEPIVEPELDVAVPQEPIVYETEYSKPLDSPNNPDLEKNLENFYVGSDNVKIKKKIFSFKRLTIFLFVMGGVSLTGMLYLTLPKAEISIAIRKIKVDADIPVAVSKKSGSSNLANGIIPGEYFMLSKSGSKTFSTEGIKKETSLRSRGFITIYNAYSSAPQRLVAQTRFETKDGKIFRLQAPIIVPGAKVVSGKLTPSSIKAEVVADVAGLEYNIGPSYFTIPGFKESPKYAGFYAQSSEEMASGKIGSVSTIDQIEIEKAKLNLQEQLIKEIENDTLSTLKDSSDFKLIKGASSVKIDEFKSSVLTGSSADSFTINMKITWQAMFFRERDLRALIGNFVSLKYPELGAFKFEGDINYPSATKTDFKKGELFFTLKIDEENALGADINNLKKELAGQNENEMRALISNKLFISSATISLWPFWVSRAPTNLNRVNITIDKEKAL
ncbi:MAG: hypothetical protein HYW79_03605 [Parcubacteria group bacterium]|nr:hypothetical protein [Parcubacteria group bacterium]